MSRGQPQTFGTLLKRYRVAAGLTQEALAERAHLSARAISDLERGVNQTPRHDTVRLLAAALSLSPQERAAFAVTAHPSEGMALSPSFERAASSLPAYPRQPGAAGVADDALPLVGRARELALLDHHLDAALNAERTPPVLLLAGEPGIGKSRLLQEAARRAVAIGWRVLADGCQRRGGEPYAPLLGALQLHLAHQEPLHLRAELAGCAWLVHLLPELAEDPIEPLPAWTLSPEQERRLMFAAVRRLLANVAGPAGTLLVLDDLQWANPDAQDLLMSLVRSAGTVPLRVVGAYRDTEAGPDDPLAVMLADLAHAGLATHHTIGPLALEEAAGLVDELLEGAEDGRAGLREQVVRRAGRVPFFIVSWARALQTGHTDELRADTLPWDLAQSVRQRVSTLPAFAQEVLGVAAVVGRVVQRGLLAATVHLPAEDLLDALESACQARLLEEQGTDVYQFAHDVIREVVEGDLSAARRAHLHRRIALALEQVSRTPPVEALAYHYARSDDQEKAVRYLEQAGDQARAQYANAAAEDYYNALIDCLNALGRTAEAAKAREKLATVLTTVGRYADARSALEPAMQFYQTAGDLEHWGGALAQMGHLYSLDFEWDAGLAALRPTVPSLEAGGVARGVAEVCAALAELYWGSGQREEGLAAAERAAAFARASGDHHLLGVAEERRATLLRSWVGRQGEALQILEEARRAAETAGDLEILFWTLTEPLAIHTFRGEFETAQRYLAQALAVAQRQGNPAQLGGVAHWTGVLAFYSGDLERARQSQREAETLFRQATDAWAPVRDLVKGLVLLMEGEHDAARRVLEEAMPTSRPIKWLAWPLAECDLLQGHAEAARTRLIPLLDPLGREEFDDNAVLVVLAWAHLEVGDLTAAERAICEALTRMRVDDDRLDLVNALRVHAMVLTRQEHWAEAEQSLEEGRALARAMPYPYAEARLLHAYGEMHAKRGDGEAARERLEAALTIFRRLGALWYVERVERELVNLTHA
jgi:transcriptional regulator with XRE-family HTH domain/tetratricopeptide (TPR) repeat protein